MCARRECRAARTRIGANQSEVKMLECHWLNNVYFKDVFAA